MQNFLNILSWPIVIIACLTLGLAPFRPQPHLWGKINMLMEGTLSAPADIFDLLMHGAPWIVLALKLGVTILGRKA